MRGTVVVIAAHAFEARAAAGVGRGVVKEPWGSWMLYRGEMWDTPLAVIRSGPGKVSAAAATQAAVQYLDPAAIVSFGVAGSPDVQVETGTMIVSHSVVDVALADRGNLPVEIPSNFVCHPELKAAFLDVPGGIEGVVLSWEGQVASPADRPPYDNVEDLPVAVDWEGASVAQVAQMWEIPWVALKVISDHGEPDRLRRVAVAARRPLQWAAEIVRRACTTYLDDQSRAETGRRDEPTESEAPDEDRETSSG